MNLPPFYSGQKVAALTDLHSDSFGVHINKGDVFSVSGLRFCCEWRISIGLTSPQGMKYSCGGCDVDFTGGPLWLPSVHFAPLEEKPFPLITLSKMKEKQEILIAN